MSSSLTTPCATPSQIICFLWASTTSMLAVPTGYVTVRTEHPTGILWLLLDWASRRGEELEGLTVTRPTLEDVYLALTAEGRE